MYFVSCFPFGRYDRAYKLGTKGKENKVINEIYFDGNDSVLLRSLMAEHGNSTFPYHGQNEDGEDVEIHIAPDSIIHKTYQKNGWVRANHYDEDGFPNGEIFEGRWK